MLPTKFLVNWLFGSEEEAKNRFSRWQPSWISNQNDFSYIDLLVTPMLPIKFQDNWPFVSEEAIFKIDFKMASMMAILDFKSKQF